MTAGKVNLRVSLSSLLPMMAAPIAEAPVPILGSTKCRRMAAEKCSRFARGQYEIAGSCIPPVTPPSDGHRMSRNCWRYAVSRTSAFPVIESQMRTTTKAALLYVLPAFAVSIVWYILLFVAKETVSPGFMLKFVLVEDPMHLWYRWILMLPLLWLGLATTYLTQVAAMRSGAITLLGIGLLLAICTWLTLDSSVGVFASLPLLYSVRCVQEAYRTKAA